MADNLGLLELSDVQREELQGWAQSRSLPAGDVFRARIILALADGLTYREIERRLGASAPTVSKWKGRFEQHGMEGLQGRHRGSKPSRATPAVQARVIRRAFVGGNEKRIWAMAAVLVPKDGKRAWKFNQAIMELGALICVARKPKCPECPVRKDCKTGRRLASKDRRR